MLLGEGEVKLAFVKEGEDIYLISTSGSNRWPSSLLRKGEAMVECQGASMRMAAILVSRRKDEIVEKFRAKYGEEAFARYFREPDRIIRLMPRKGNEGNTYYTWLEAEFDSVAEDYDAHIYGNVINVLLRERSLATLKLLFPEPSFILDIGCGSGTETIELLRRGHQVVAVDISGKMLEMVKAKAAREGLAEGLRTLKLRAAQIGEVMNMTGESAFHGAYSTYGALNCETSLTDIPPSLYRLLMKKGKVLLGVYNKWCMSEATASLARLRFRRALYRARNPVKEGDSRFCIDIFSYSPGEMENIFRPYFSVLGVEGVPVLLPPSNYDAYVRRFQNNFSLLKELDRHAGRIWPFRLLGDHFLMSLQKADAG